MRVWDARRAIQTVRVLPELSGLPLVLSGERQAAGIALYAGLFEPELARLELRQLGPSHREGPILLNVRRYLDIPQAVAMAAERSEIVLTTGDPAAWSYPEQVAQQLGWGENRIRLVKGSRPADSD